MSGDQGGNQSNELVVWLEVQVICTRIRAKKWKEEIMGMFIANVPFHDLYTNYEGSKRWLLRFWFEQLYK